MNDTRMLVYVETTAALLRLPLDAARTQRVALNLQRTLLKTVITSYGQDMATANVKFQRAGSDRAGRQSQTWIRPPEVWRVVAAHVSLLS